MLSRDMFHTVIQIFPVKACDDNPRIVQFQGTLNICPDLPRGSRREGAHDRSVRKAVYKGNNL